MHASITIIAVLLKATTTAYATLMTNQNSMQLSRERDCCLNICCRICGLGDSLIGVSCAAVIGTIMLELLETVFTS